MENTIATNGLTITNKHGCLPPKDCRMPTNSAQPQIAVGSDSPSSWQATFLVDADELDKFLLDAVRISWTLKAWFAYMIRANGVKDELDLEPRFPTWERVWDVLQRCCDDWITMHEHSAGFGTHATRWEFGAPECPLDLYARGILVLVSTIQTNTDHLDRSVRSLRWHDYYYEAEGKCFACYHFMLYLRRTFGANRTNSIYIPKIRSRMENWQLSDGHKIRQMSEDFIQSAGWDPLNMLGESLRNASTQKLVTFVHTQDHGLRVYKKSIAVLPRCDHASIHSALKILLDVESQSVSAVDCGNNQIKTCKDLLEYATSSTDPMIWLCNDPLETTVSTGPETQSQNDYSSHAVLKLEPLLGYVTPKEDTAYAEARFRLIRENHRYSGDFVDEVKEFFADVDAAATGRWQRLLEIKRLRESGMQDKSQFYKLKPYMTELSDGQKAHAEHYFALVDTSSPLANAAATELNNLFMPDDIEWEALSKITETFDTFKKESEGDPSSA